MIFKQDRDILFPQDVIIEKKSKEFMHEIKSLKVKDDQIALWSLGQNSIIIKDPYNNILVIDPYLTDFCASKKTGIRNKKSRILPVFIEPEDLECDFILLTHSHCDHTDPFTLERLSIKEKVRFLAPFQSKQILEKIGYDKKQIKLMHPNEIYILDNIKITGTFALPTDPGDLNHLGYLIEFANGKRYYNTGDTAPCFLLDSLNEQNIDFMHVCINGGYRNLGHFQAAELISRIKPKKVAPVHYDMIPHNLQPLWPFKNSLQRNASDTELVIHKYYHATYF